MTVIATDGRTMAGDSMTSASGQIMRFQQKVHRLKDGRVAGACGLTTDCQQLIRWLDEGGDKPTLGEEVAALVLNVDGTVDWIDNKFEIVRNGLLPAAIGSGGDLAIGMMLAGKSPKDAVELVCTRQIDCGGPITTLAPLAAVEEAA